MGAVKEHTHSFARSGWPFSEPTNAMAFTTRPVLQEGHPVLLVTHDEDGDWQFMCTTTNDPADGLVVCLGCAYESDSTIGDVADLPPGWQAWRDYVGGPWDRVHRPADIDDA